MLQPMHTQLLPFFCLGFIRCCPFGYFLPRSFNKQARNERILSTARRMRPVVPLEQQILDPAGPEVLFIVALVVPCCLPLTDLR